MMFIPLIQRLRMHLRRNPRLHAGLHASGLGAASQTLSYLLFFLPPKHMLRLGCILFIYFYYETQPLQKKCYSLI